MPDSPVIESVYNFPDLNALPCYKLESKMHKVEPNYDVKVPAVVDSSLPTSSPDLLEHRLSKRYLLSIHIHMCFAISMQLEFNY